MKRISELTLRAVTAALVMLPASASSQKEVKKSSKETVKLHIETMNCNNCVKKIEKNIAFEKGVTDLKCDLKTQTVEVTYRKDKTSEESLLKAFEKIGEPASVVKTDAPVKTGREGH